MYRGLTNASINGSWRAFFSACVLSACLLGVGCNRQPTKQAFDNLDITNNSAFGADFALPDTSSRLRTLADFRGKVVVMFFGYAYCPDVCPTTMTELAQAMQQLGDAAKDVQVLFVTVDPQRDTPSLLARYVAAFNPSFMGLRPANDTQLKKSLQIFASTMPKRLLQTENTILLTTHLQAMCLIVTAGYGY